jgi:hypothetical protein
MLAIAPELTMADPGAQSDEMDIASIDSDRADPGAADAAGVVCPLRVKSSARRPKRGYRNRPVESAGAGPSIYYRTLDRGL